jgi:hypothetical protein
MRIRRIKVVRDPGGHILFISGYPDWVSEE